MQTLTVQSRSYTTDYRIKKHICSIPIPPALYLPSIMRCVQKWFGQGLLFQQTKSSNITQASRHHGLSTPFHHHMAFFMHACEKLLLYYRVLWLKCMDNSCKIEGHYHEQSWTMWLLWRGVQTSHIHNWLTAICGGKASTHSTTVFNWVCSFSSGKDSGQKGLSPSICQHCVQLPHCKQYPMPLWKIHA